MVCTAEYRNLPRGGVGRSPRDVDRKDERVRRLLALPRSWGSLCSIFEIVASDVSPGDWKTIGVSIEDLVAFERAVDGDERQFFARFRSKATPVWNLPLMTLDDAYDFVRRMVGEWMRWRSLWMDLAYFDHPGDSERNE